MASTYDVITNRPIVVTPRSAPEPLPPVPDVPLTPPSDPIPPPDADTVHCVRCNAEDPKGLTRHTIGGTYKVCHECQKITLD